MKPTVFNDEVASAVKNWHRKAKKRVKHSIHSEKNTPFSSRPGTPTHGMSPVHLLHNHNYRRNMDDLFAPPEASTGVEMEHWDTEGSHHPENNIAPSDTEEIIRQTSSVRELGQIQELPAPRHFQTQHGVNISSSNFSFGKSRN